jgi:hypothetical protein
MHASAVAYASGHLVSIRHLQLRVRIRDVYENDVMLLSSRTRLAVSIFARADGSLDLRISTRPILDYALYIELPRPGHISLVLWSPGVYSTPPAESSHNLCYLFQISCFRDIVTFERPDGCNKDTDAYAFANNFLESRERLHY